MIPAEAHNPYPVSDTAALVMLWASTYYAGKPLTGRYLARLDLSAGREMVERYNAICPWYSEVIINRKHFIRSSVEALLRGRRGPAAIINLGAGFSPLTLELAPVLAPDVRVIEMDVRNMEKKARLYADIVPEKCSRISCLEADIGDIPGITALLAPLIDARRTRLIVVMEGLTYYIPRPVMERVLRCLAGLACDQAVVFEHLKPCSLISDERRFIPYRIFSDVRDYTGMDRMTTYSDGQIREMLGPSFRCRYADMDLMERQRTGVNRYFPAPDSGWLSCAVAERREPDTHPS